MALPSTRTEFKKYVLRNLGSPVIKINVDDDQIEDRIDEALIYYQDYHFDGTDKIYYKFQIAANNRPNKIYDLTINNGGTLYSNSDTVVFTGGGGSNASANIVTNSNGTIISATLSNNGIDYATTPTISITTSTGSGASITAELGGWIPIPENIISVTNVFDMGSAFNTNYLFSTTYQFFLNDIYSLTSSSLAPYYMAMQHVSLMQELLIGKVLLRYNRHKDKLYLDMNWSRMADGNYIVIEAYQTVDPDTYTDVWKDRWLLRYTTALVKRQWGNNMKKYDGMTMPNGMKFNGQQIYDEAIAEIAKLEDEMINSYSLPVYDQIS